MMQIPMKNWNTTKNETINDVNSEPVNLYKNGNLNKPLFEK
jgi:hypothetical protein